MEQHEQIKKIGWYHMFILKALVSEPTFCLSTKDIGKKIGYYHFRLGFPFNSSAQRIFFLKKMQLLLDLGIVSKSRSSFVSYTLTENYRDAAKSFLAGYECLIGDFS